MTKALTLGIHYFELSDKANLEKIRNLFTPSSTYSSAYTEVYLGADQIMEMQTEFFAKFESMKWDIHSSKEVGPGVVLFDFTFTGKTLDGENVCRPGLEYVIFFDGKLQHVDVRNRH
jgi:hypothetical protein